MATNDVDVKKMMDELKRLREKEEKAKDRTRKYGERSRIRSKLFMDKAKAAGITVTDEEIDQELAKG